MAQHKPRRPGAVRGGRKGPIKGSGGRGRRALEGKGPTPKAEDRPYHAAAKKKVAREHSRGAELSASRRPRQAGSRQGQAPQGRGRSRDESEILSGRNSVLEALRARVPASVLYVVARIESDDRVRSSLSLAASSGIPVLEITRSEIDRLVGRDAVHQGVALKVPPYNYVHPTHLLDEVLSRGELPLLTALDGVTDPRNLGAIIRSAAALGGQGVVVPQRRSVGVTAAAWKTSAGSAAHLPVAMTANLTQTLKAFQKRGLFVVGLTGDVNLSVSDMDFADEPLVLVIGGEGKGLSRLVRETCDALVSIPMRPSVDSLNAAVATGIALYEIARLRSR
jgi:23S rRNA (guanosine2251-2'-O)-methyltransferase